MAGPASSVGPIPGYEIKSKLGAGGMGVVYKAIDLKLNRTVALKFLADQEIGQPDHERLLREARAASALDHPNIATVFSVQEAPDGRTFIVMGYYEGETLTEKIRHSPLQPAHAVNVAMQVAAGLQHAHSRGIVHRDIKSSNILITNEGTPKILDFGLARIHGPAVSTETTPLGGTLYYMSPEQAEGRPIDHRTDIWSLGIVLYQMLTGRVPFITDNAGSTLLAILNDAPAPMPTVPEELQIVILRCLAKTPAARYQTSTELLRDLEKLAFDDRQPTVTYSSRSDLQKQLKLATHSATAPPVVRMSYRALWLAAAMLVTIGLGLALFLSPLRARLFGPSEKHIAVLPFDTPDSDAASQTLAAGLMESIAGKLATLDTKESLWVVPGSEVRRRNVRDIESARKEFGATLAVKGAVERSGNGVHITVDLIDTRNLRLLGSASLERSNAQLAALDDDAVDRLSRFMGLEAHPSAPSEKTAGAVYEEYLKGRGYLQQFDKPGNLDKAAELFQQVIAGDPKFALGHAALAEAFFDHYGLDSNADWLRKAADSCKHAMDLSNKLPAVYVTCGRVHDASGMYELALSEFQRGIDLDPRSADARIGFASVYEHLKRIDEAEKYLQEAAAMRPDYWYFTYQLGAFYTRQRRFPEAEREFRRVVAMNPDSAYAQSNLGSVLEVQGSSRYAEAESVLKKSLDLGPTYVAYNNLGTMYLREKRWTDAAAMFQKALELNAHDYRPWGNLGLAYEWLNQQERAAQAYEQELPILEAQAKLQPTNAKLQVELANLYSKQKQADKAKSYVQSALLQAPDNPQVLSDAAEVYDNLGDRGQALALARKSLAKGRTMTELQENPGLRGVLADPHFRAPNDSGRK